MRVRTINQAAQAFKDVDPGTIVTPHVIRRLILDGKIPYTRSGTKYLVALEVLEDYFKGGLEE